MPMEMVFVYTTFPDMETARGIVRELLRRKLIACANLREHESIYTWKGEIREEREVGAILKTSVEKWKALKESLRELHPYEVPLILRIDVDRVNSEYAKWLEEVLS